MTSSIKVIIPAYNEASSIGKVIQALPKYIEEIIAVFISRVSIIQIEEYKSQDSDTLPIILIILTRLNINVAIL